MKKGERGVFDEPATVTKENLDDLYEKLTEWYDIGRHQLRGDSATQRNSLLATVRLWAFHIFFDQNRRIGKKE